MPNGPEDPVLSEKDLEIIAVGASVAAGCLPCTRFHLRAASDAGADDVDIRRAVQDATRVRRAATEVMARAGGLPEVEASEATGEPAGVPSLVRELVSVGAAYAVNCSTSLDAHIAAARALGATDRQVFAAVRIACSIRDVAVQKAKAVVGRALGVPEEQAASCGCGPAATPAEDAGTCECSAGEPRRDRGSRHHASLRRRVR